jgi:hypothetical protein
MQSPTEIIARKILTSSANNKHLECLITLQRSLIKKLESKGPKTSLWGPPKKKTGNKRCLKCVQKFADQKGNYETSLPNRQKAN